MGAGRGTCTRASEVTGGGGMGAVGVMGAGGGVGADRGAGGMGGTVRDMA